MKEQYTKVLGPDGKPINKALDLRSFFGKDLPDGYSDAWLRQPKPRTEDLIRQYKSVAYACANLNTQLVVKTPIRLYYRKRNGRKSRWPVKSIGPKRQEWAAFSAKMRLSNGEMVEEITEHPILDLLNRPNPSADWDSLLEMTQLFQEIVGKAAWYKAKNALGTPAEVWLLCPQWLKAVRNSDGAIERYEYGSGGRKQEYSPDEVFEFLVPNPSAPGQDGMSPIVAAWDQINTETKLAATTQAILDNEGRPSGIIAAKDGIGEDEAARWEHRFNAKFRRAGNGGVVVLEEDSTFTPLQFSPRDLSWLSIHDTSRLAIANAYGVPYALIDKGGQSQYQVDVTIRQRHVEDAGLIRLRRNQSVLNRFLVSDFDPSGDLFLAFDDPSPTNREIRRADLALLASNGSITKNELRAEFGFDEEAGMDDPAGQAFSIPVSSSLREEETLSDTEPSVEEVTTNQDVEALPALAMNGAQIASAVQIVQAVAAGQLPRDSGIGALEVLLNLTAEQAERMMGSVGNGFKPEAPAESAPPPAPVKSCDCGHCKAPEKPSERLIIPSEIEAPKTKRRGLRADRKAPEGKELAKVLQEFFKRQATEIVGSLKKSIADYEAKGQKADLPEEFVDLEDWDKDLYQDARPVIELYFEKEYEEAAKDFIARAGASPDVFNVTDPHLKEKVRKLALEFCRSTNETTSQEINAALRQLRAELEEGLVQGDRMTDLTKRVQGVFERAEKERAWLIAQTEASRSHSEALRQSAIDSGVVKGFRLLLSSAACPLCVSSQKEIGLNDYFHKDESAPAPYTNRLVPLHPGCMCSLEAVLED